MARVEHDNAARVRAFLDAHHVMSLATWQPQGVHVVSLFYARDEFSLLWVSDPKTRHSLAIENNGRVGATIAPDYRSFEEVYGVQISGTARRITGAAERRRARSLLEARYPFLTRLSGNPALSRAYDAAELYRLLPHEIAIIDNARGFGHKDVLELAASA